MSAETSSAHDYARAHVRRALARDEVRETRRRSLMARVPAVSQTLHDRYGAGISVYLFGSVLEPEAFRVDSDVDLAVRGIPSDRYYEAWRVAEEVLDDGCLDLIRLESAPAWLVEVVQTRGQLMP